MGQNVGQSSVAATPLSPARTAVKSVVELKRSSEERPWP